MKWIINSSSVIFQIIKNIKDNFKQSWISCPHPIKIVINFDTPIHTRIDPLRQINQGHVRRIIIHSDKGYFILITLIRWLLRAFNYKFQMISVHENLVDIQQNICHVDIVHQLLNPGTVSPFAFVPVTCKLNSFFNTFILNSIYKFRQEYTFFLEFCIVIIYIYNFW